MGNYFLSKIKLFFSKKAVDLSKEIPVSNEAVANNDNQPEVSDSKAIDNTQKHFLYTNKDNSMFNYGIGGQSVPQEASEAMADISPNRSIFVQKLTQDESIKPEAVYDLKTVEEVFQHFKPNVSVDFETDDGTVKNEELHFGNLGDFGVKSITEKSPFLQELARKQEQYQKISSQIKSNKLLIKALEKQETKAAFVNALQTLINDLEEK